MEEMARELQACTAAPLEARPTASLAELRARVAALTAISREQVTQSQERQDQLTGAWQELAEIVAETATELNDLLTFYIHSQDNGYQATELLERSPFTPALRAERGVSAVPRRPSAACC
jgi:hypothetical protein